MRSDKVSRTSEDLEDFSRYCDGLFRRRTTLAASLFPEKQAAWWLAIRYSFAVIGPLTDWLSDQFSPEEYADHLRSTPLGAANFFCFPLHYSLARTGYLLQQDCNSTEASTTRDLEVLGYWFRFFRAAVSLQNDPPWSTTASKSSQFIVLDRLKAQALNHTVLPISEDQGPGVTRAIAQFTSYSWLLECETRSGIYSHGPYPAAAGERLLIREFQDLSGQHFPWVTLDTELPCQTIAIVTRVKEVALTFDLPGTVQVEPANYSANVTGLSVLIDGRPVADPIGQLSVWSAAVRRAHIVLYRKVAALTPRERFYGQSVGMLRHHERYVRAVGGSDADIERLIRQPFHAAMDNWLDAHVARTTQVPIWERVERLSQGRNQSTLFAPMLPQQVDPAAG